MATLDLVVNLDIQQSISNASVAQFSSILLIGRSKSDFTGVGEYTSVSEVLAAGFDENSHEYKAASVIFAQSTTVDKIFIVQRLPSGSPIVYESFMSAYERALSEKYFYAVIPLTVVPGVDDSGLSSLALRVEGDKKIISFFIGNTDADLNFLNSLKIEGYRRTICIYSDTDSETFSNAGYVGRFLPIQPGSASWTYKEIVGVPADNLSNTKCLELQNLNCNYYTYIGDTKNTRNGVTMNGTYIDVLYGLDWLENLIGVSMLNSLRSVYSVPYTEAGINLIVSTLDSCLKQAQQLGFLSEYVITAPAISQIPSIDKTNRVLNNVKFTAVLSGAIHNINIKGDLVNNIINGTIII